ncbi:MAG TPA: type II toxin-antitoxin system RelB/DinJ family antitoxin [Candidatus Acidoferrum sp.]|nr:type II toxin-antitoxin system RelB/DinJ family antitoxin [Candidatus Acidoferrum sp.]
MPTTMVHVRVEPRVKRKAERALKAMGLSVSDAVRVLLVRVAEEQAIPFDIEVPNTKTIAAMRELDEGKGKMTTVNELFARFRKPRK